MSVASQKLLSDFEAAFGVVEAAFEPSPYCLDCGRGGEFENSRCSLCEEKQERDSWQDARDDQADMETERLLEEKAGI